jgi:Flp pilus assembly protein TadG
MTTVEAALITPLFLLVIFALIEFGHTWYVYHAITSASREGARYAVMYRNVPGTSVRQAPSAFTPSIESVIDDYLLQFFGGKFWTVSCSGCGSTTSGDRLTVTVTATKSWVVLGLLAGLTDAFPLTVATTMELE